MFPKISHLNDLLPFIQDNQQIRVKPCEITGHTVVCYMLQDEDTFDGEHQAYERECRGITFAPDGQISARALHKFFNVGERDSTLPTTIMWSNVDRIMEKRDGSMITPVLIDQSTFRMKTKKSFDTKEAFLAHELCANPVRYEWVLNVLKAGITPTFEVTSPKYPIVVVYTSDELTLLHARENISGRYLTEDELVALNAPFPIVKNLKEQFIGCGVPANIVSWEKLKAQAETVTGIEGWVIQFKNGDMVKLKTSWYIALHHAVTFTRWRDIARTVVADEADDLKGAFAMTGRSIEPILKVERTIMGKIKAAQNAVNEHVENGHILNRTAKDMAAAFKDHDLFGLVMRAFRGQAVDYLDWYRKNHLEADWDLEVVAVHEPDPADAHRSGAIWAYEE